jgi:hypothetical protein
MRTSRRNLQYLDDVATTSPSPPCPTLARKIHNQNNNDLLIFSFCFTMGMPPFIGFERLKFLGYIWN